MQALMSWSGSILTSLIRYPNKTMVVLYQDSEPLAEVVYNSENPMLDMLLRKLCNPASEIPVIDSEVLKSQILQGIYVTSVNGLRL